MVGIKSAPFKRIRVISLIILILGLSLIGGVMAQSYSAVYPNNWAYSEFIGKDIFDVSLFWIWENMTFEVTENYYSTGSDVFYTGGYFTLTGYTTGTGANPTWSAWITNTKLIQSPQNNPNFINGTVWGEAHNSIINQWVNVVFYGSVALASNGSVVYNGGILSIESSPIVLYRFPPVEFNEVIS